MTLTSITIQWDQVPCIEQNSEIASYRVKYGIIASSDEVRTVTAQMFSASGLIPMSTYSFQVAAVNHDNTEGPYSGPIEITTPSGNVLPEWLPLH